MEHKTHISNLLHIEQATSLKTGEVVGYRLRSMSDDSTLLLWADQSTMKGFRVGDKFNPNIGEEIAYTELFIEGLECHEGFGELNEAVNGGEHCSYPECNCPFDMGPDARCLRGLPKTGATNR